MFKLFQLDIEKFFEEEFVFLKQLNFSPIDFDEMEYYRYYYLRKNYMDFIEKEKRQREQEEKGQDSKFSYRQMMEDSRKYMPSNSGGVTSNLGGVPKMPNFDTGSLTRGYKL